MQGSPPKRAVETKIALVKELAEYTTAPFVVTSFWKNDLLPLIVAGVFRPIDDVMLADEARMAKFGKPPNWSRETVASWNADSQIASLRAHGKAVFILEKHQFLADVIPALL
uniref:Uncharacterized protein n=1 Tax=viral metagenome TaxID=1070528 RepID=A0A2V0R9W5_9ZZZZ